MTTCYPRQPTSVAAIIAFIFYVIFIIGVSTLALSSNSSTTSTTTTTPGKTNKNTPSFGSSSSNNNNNNDDDVTYHHHHAQPHNHVKDSLSIQEEEEEEDGLYPPFGSSSSSSVENDGLSIPKEDEDDEDDVLYQFDDDNDGNENHHGYNTNNSGEAMIVCGVDGTVYTLDAWTGELRGLFPSGASLIASSGSTQASETTTERIVPGLDGHLYSLTESSPNSLSSSSSSAPQLDMLPLQIEDVMQSPVSTCSSSSNSNSKNSECGMVMGQKSTKVFAVNVDTGTVQWMQHASGKDGGFTTRHLYKPSTTSTNVILLQREDYTVRHIDQQTGEETWKVQLGKFSALEFNHHPHRNHNHNDFVSTTTTSVSTKTYNHNNPTPNCAGGGAGESTPSSSSTSSSSSWITSRIPELPNSKMNNKNKHHHKSSSRSSSECGPKNPTTTTTTTTATSWVSPLPSIAFGADGTTFMGIDSTSGKVLWKRQIDSIVASTYGVNSSGQWTSLVVLEDYPFDEDEDDEDDEDDSTIHSNNNNNVALESYSIQPLKKKDPPPTRIVPLLPQPSSSLLTSSSSQLEASSSSSMVVIYEDAPPPSSSSVHARVGQHSSNFFVLSTLPQVVTNTHSKKPLMVPWQHTTTTTSTTTTTTHNHKPSLASYPPLIDPPATLLDKLTNFVQDEEDEEEEEEEEENDTSVTLRDVMRRDGVDLSDPKSISDYLHRLSSLQQNNNNNNIHHGLFLSWQMIAMLLSLLFGLVVCGHLFYQKQKRKWKMEGTPIYLPLTSSHHYHHPHDNSSGSSHTHHPQQQQQQQLLYSSSHPTTTYTTTRSNGSLNLLMVKHSPSSASLKTNNNNNNSIFPPPLHLEQTAAVIPNTVEARKTDFQKKSPVLRSISLPQIHTLHHHHHHHHNSSSQSSSTNGDNNHNNHNTSQSHHRIHPSDQNTKIDKDILTMDSSPESSSNDMNNTANNNNNNNDDDDIPNHKDLPSSSMTTPTFKATTTTAGMTMTSTYAPTTANKSTNAVSVVEKQQQQPPPPKSFLETVSQIDGIPLVRYSRYRSEFYESTRLGKGGFGTVFKCSNALDGREYAIKKVLIHTSADPHCEENNAITKKFSQKLQRVLREVKILAMLDHKNVVRYYTAWLELENEDDIVVDQDQCTDESSSILLNTTTTRMARGYSSELLAGTGTSTYTNGNGGGGPSILSNKTNNNSSNNSTSMGSQSIRSKYHNQNTKQIQQSQTSNIYNPKNNSNSNNTNPKNTNNALYHNPLGGWNSFYQPGPFDEEEQWSAEQKSNASSSNQDQRLSSHHSSSSIASEEDLGFHWERSYSSQFNSLGMKRRDQSLDTIHGSDNDNDDDDDDDDESSCCSSNSGDSWSIADTHNHSNKINSEDRDLWDALLKRPEHDLSPTEKTQGNNHPSSLETKSNPRSSSSSSSSGSDKCQAEKLLVKNRRHILYIQMQLCSQKTLSDFLENSSERLRSSNKSSRTTNEEVHSRNESAIDIPYALRMFSQIAQGVKHVHQQGLIHRDLKPSNCFIDDSGVVKIGDFGLSRESASAGLDENNDIATTTDIRNDENNSNNSPKQKDNYLGRGQDNTAGVGTRSYASPEQMNGSDYDSSTDVYSLGIILFELCYLMSTGMERHLVFKGIRRRIFPDQWHNTVAKAFPSLHTLLMSMLSPNPSERPSSAAVAGHIDALLSEYTVLSLDYTKKQDSSVLLRVEAEDNEGVLPRTIKMIKEADPNIVILQYGLRGQESKAIMEFALSFCTGNNNSSDEKTSMDQNHFESVTSIFKKLENCKEIKSARQVSEKHMSRQSSMGSASSGLI